MLALGHLPDPDLLAVSLAGSLIVAAVGYRVFKNLEPRLADVV